MKIAVTGGTGFLGRYVVSALLQKGYQVIALGRNLKVGALLEEKGAVFIRADLSDVGAMTSAFKGCTVVLHLAALSSPWGKKEIFHKINVLGTENVLKAISNSGVARLVHVSTPSIYFDYKDRLLVREDDPLPGKMVNEYAKSKLAAEKLVFKAGKDGLEVIIVRPRALFGPHDTVLLTRLIRVNEKIGIPFFSRRELITDLTYVGNASDAIVLCIKAESKCLGKAYNISNGEPAIMADVLGQLLAHIHRPFNKRYIPASVCYGLARIAEGISLFTGKEPKITRYGLGVLNTSMSLDITRAKVDLGYSPRVSIEDGLEKFARWWNGEGRDD
jgi:nucleoside-diphosphate-sugar epimerase